jgi:hypothetical protein
MFNKNKNSKLILINFLPHFIPFAIGCSFMEKGFVLKGGDGIAALMSVSSFNRGTNIQFQILSTGGG